MIFQTNSIHLYVYIYYLINNESFNSIYLRKIGRFHFKRQINRKNK